MKKIIQMGTALSRSSQKLTKGGLVDGGSCCAHTSDWEHYRCNLSQAQAKADSYPFWCCTSCHDSCINATGGPCPV